MEYPNFRRAMEALVELQWVVLVSPKCILMYLKQEFILTFPCASHNLCSIRSGIIVHYTNKSHDHIIMMSVYLVCTSFGRQLFISYIIICKFLRPSVLISAQIVNSFCLYYDLWLFRMSFSYIPKRIGFHNPDWIGIYQWKSLDSNQFSSNIDIQQPIFLLLACCVESILIKHSSNSMALRPVSKKALFESK